MISFRWKVAIASLMTFTVAGLIVLGQENQEDAQPNATDREKNGAKAAPGNGYGAKIGLTVPSATNVNVYESLLYVQVTITDAVVDDYDGAVKAQAIRNSDDYAYPWEPLFAIPGTNSYDGSIIVPCEENEPYPDFRIRVTADYVGIPDGASTFSPFNGVCQSAGLAAARVRIGSGPEPSSETTAPRRQVAATAEKCPSAGDAIQFVEPKLSEVDGNKVKVTIRVKGQVEQGKSVHGQAIDEISGEEYPLGLLKKVNSTDYSGDIECPSSTFKIRAVVDFAGEGKKCKTKCCFH